MRGAGKFCSSVFKGLRTVGHHMSSSTFVVAVLDAPNIMQLLRGDLQGVHKFDLYSPRSALSDEVVSCTYHHWFRPYSKHRRYCQLHVSCRRMQRFLQEGFRLASHNLPTVLLCMLLAMLRLHSHLRSSAAFTGTAAQTQSLNPCACCLKQCCPALL